MSSSETFTLSHDYSTVYHKFLSRDLRGYAAIRGQVIGPVSFGFRVNDETNRPIIYNEEVQTLLFDFIQRKVNVQVAELRVKNKNAFVWLDEPGLGWVFSGLSGYSDVRAKQDYHEFLGGIDGIKSLHLCANVNLPYLLGMGTELLSFDAYQMELMPKGYAQSIADFLVAGGTISWGIVPTDSGTLDKQTPDNLAELLNGYWEVVAGNSGLPIRRIAEQALIAPARCCLKNLGLVGANGEGATCKVSDSGETSEERVVAKAFGYLRTISGLLKTRHGIT